MTRSHAAAPAAPSALTLLEDSVHLLRRAPAGAWLFHFLGAGLWVLAILFAWAGVSWFRPSRDALAAGALLLVALYAWLKTAQSEFCARLMSLCLGASPEKFTLRRAARLAAAQFAPHAPGPAILVIAGVIAAPFARACLYFQTTTVLGDRATNTFAAAPTATPVAAVAIENNENNENESGAMTLAKLWPRQGMLGLLVITAFALLVFINLAIAFYMMPSLARTLFGVENFMSVSGWSALNTTFLMSVAALTWFAIDPLVKAFSVLRVFHGHARRTGADLLIEMDRARAPRSAAVLVALALLACALAPESQSKVMAGEVSFPHELLPGNARVPRAGLGVTPKPSEKPASGETPDAARETRALPKPMSSSSPTQPRIAPADLNRAIDEVLDRGEFRWQMPPAKTQTDADDSNFITRLFTWFYDVLKSIARAAGDFLRWVHDLFSRKNPNAMTEPYPSTESANGMPLLQLFLYGLIAVLAGMLVWVFYTAWRKSDASAINASAARPSPAAATPDLADENAHASQLPCDGWLKLAREQAALGEWRLALRALYLAHLARLDAEGLLTLKRHKTNLDYERELRRRALQRAALGDWFAARRREFEETWYGRARPGEEQVRAWFDEVEKGAPAA